MKLITSIYYDCRLLPHFLAHYERLGVDRFLCLVNVNKNPEILGQVTALCSNHDFSVVRIIDEMFTGGIYAYLDKVRQELESTDDWVLTVDLDEFIEPPLAIPDLIERCERAGCDYVQGTLVDRVTEDGSFPELLEGDIAGQFPIAASVTSALTGGCCSKVPLRRTSCPLVPGLHSAVGRALDDVNMPVYHYKWFSGVVDRMYDRLCTRLSERSSDWQGTMHFIDYYSRTKRIDLSNPLLQARRVGSREVDVALPNDQRA